MGVTATSIARQLAKLLPQGAAWPRVLTARLHDLLLAAADELARIYGRGEDLLAEAHPATIDEMLADWEQELGLPDVCVTEEQTTEERRAAIAAKLLQVGGQSRQYYIDVAGGLDIEVTIEEHHPFYVGIHGCGDPIGEIDWKFTWTMHAPDETSAASRQALECSISNIAPAHTRVLFSYD